jgi:hypothetical protein
MLTTSLHGLRGMGLILNLRYPQPARRGGYLRLTEHVPVFVSPFVSPGCMKMGTLLTTWDDEASSASY